MESILTIQIFKIYHSPLTRGEARLKAKEVSYIKAREQRIIDKAFRHAVRSKFVTQEQVDRTPGTILVHSKAMEIEFVGKVTIGLAVKIITVYDNTIRRVIEDGGTINGIKPRSFNHGVRLVIEHEVAHIINSLNGRYGHDDMFMKIVSKLFKHTEVNAVNESIQAEEEDYNRDAYNGEATKGICEGKQIASWRLHRVLSHRTGRTYNKKGGLNES